MQNYFRRLDYQKECHQGQKQLQLSWLLPQRSRGYGQVNGPKQVCRNWFADLCHKRLVHRNSRGSERLWFILPSAEEDVEEGFEEPGELF